MYEKIITVRLLSTILSNPESIKLLVEKSLNTQFLIPSEVIRQEEWKELKEEEKTEAKELIE